MSSKKKLIRDQFRLKVFERDKHHCKFCSNTEHLDAHHITDRHELPAGGYVLENGITLCPEHHIQAEVWHNSQGTDFVEGLKPEDLYRKIYSSYEAAMEASKKLEARVERIK